MSEVPLVVLRSDLGPRSHTYFHPLPAFCGAGFARPRPGARLGQEHRHGQPANSKPAAPGAAPLLRQCTARTAAATPATPAGGEDSTWPRNSNVSSHWPDSEPLPSTS